MPHLQQLISFHIIELDRNNKLFMTWTYPTISKGNKDLILFKIGLNTNKLQHFTYLRSDFDWIYITNTDVFQTDVLDIKSFSLILITKDFNPEKYSTLGRILTKCYCKTGSPVELVKLYLSVYTTGCCATQENGTFFLRDFDNINNHCTKIKELIVLFGLEVILLYTAVLLKKRVILYHHSPDILLKWLPSVISLLPHRNPNKYLFPIMDLTKDDLFELKNSSYFVAGFKDSNICSKTDFFDLLVNFPATEITIMPHAKDCLTMTKTHKDIALFMVQLAESKHLSESDVIKEISNKTSELLNYIKGLSSNFGEKITPEDIKSKNLHPAIEAFLFNLAYAENLLKY